jgi:REP element-mobilizing transposase RayT
MKSVIYDGIPEVILYKDYIHILISIPPKMRISHVVRRVKSITWRLLKKKFEYMRKAYGG